VTETDLTITADTEVDAIYADGEAVDLSGMVNSLNWQVADTVSIPSGTTVLAVQAFYGNGLAPGLLLSSELGFISNSQARCVPASPQFDNW